MSTDRMGFELVIVAGQWCPRPERTWIVSSASGSRLETFSDRW
jgi:hypothetical protein